MGCVKGETAQFPFPSADGRGPSALPPALASALPHPMSRPHGISTSPFRFRLPSDNGMSDATAHSFLGGKRTEPVSPDSSFLPQLCTSRGQVSAAVGEGLNQNHAVQGGREGVNNNTVPIFVNNILTKSSWLVSKSLGN